MAQARGSSSSSSAPAHICFRGKNPPLSPPSWGIFAAYGAHARRFLFTLNRVFPALAGGLPAWNKALASLGNPRWKYGLMSCAIHRKRVQRALPCTEQLFPVCVTRPTQPGEPRRSNAHGLTGTAQAKRCVTWPSGLILHGRHRRAVCA